MRNDTSEKRGSWLLPGPKNRDLKAGLYLVSTPVGNLGDISLRALDTLAAADAVLCEDTRVSGKLLSHYGLKKKLHVYNDHSDEKKRAEVIHKIEKGESVVLLSDAGTPLISDPGYKLVTDMRARGLYVTSVPGANAVLTALQLSGLASDRFAFVGFLPPKTGARKEFLREWMNVPSTLVAYETAPRLVSALRDIQDILGQRHVAVVRELTKLYEQVVLMEIPDLISYYEAEGAPKGEIVLVIERAREVQFEMQDMRLMIKRALETMSVKDAAAFVSAQAGLPKREVYTLALEISKG